MIHEYMRGSVLNDICKRRFDEDKQTEFTGGGEYINAFVDACIQYGLEDVGDQMLFYQKNCIGGKLSQSPQDLARKYAIMNNVQAAFYDLDDDYFEKFMDTAYSMGISDDFILKYWDGMTKFGKKYSNDPVQAAVEARKDYLHSPMYKEKTVSLDQLQQLVDEPDAPSVLAQTLHYTLQSVQNADESELVSRFGEGFYYSQKFERAPFYRFTGNTKWNGRHPSEKKGEEVVVTFDTARAKDLWCRTIWPGFGEVSSHVRSMEPKAKGPGSSESVLRDKEGNKLKTTKNGRLTGYRSSTGKWIDILEDSDKRINR